MSEARRYKYHRVFDGYNFLSAQGEMEQIVGSDMELVSAEDYDALEADNAALRRAKAEGLEQVSELKKALELYRDASYQGHSSHWDKTGGSGSGCPACLRAIELRAQARQIVDTLDARAAQIEKGEHDDSHTSND